MRRMGTVIAIHTSPGGIPKWPRETVPVGIDGLEGDGHDHDCHRTPLQAVCLIDVEMIRMLAKEGYAVYPGAMGENVTLEGMDIQSLPVGTRLAFSGGLEIELTKVRRPCFVLDSIDPNLKKDAVNRIGVYAKVLVPGRLSRGERVEVREPAAMAMS